MDPSPAPPPRWQNPRRRLPRVRAAVQAAYALFLLAVGWEFARFVEQALVGAPLTARRPPAVEAFLPISALVGLARFARTGAWDEVHPAGLTVLLAAVASALVARKAFCAWACPGGALSRLLEKAGDLTLYRRRRRPVPRWLDLPLSGLKYLLLAFFLWAVLVRMPAEAAEGFLRSPFNLSADARMLWFFAEPSATAGAVLAGLALLSVVVKHAWCRWLCPYGALLGLASLLSPQRVVRDPAGCNDCRACSRACPSDIPVHARRSVMTAECTGCLSCVAACTVPDVLGIGRRGRRAWSPWWIPGAALAVLLGAWAIARATGHWESAVPPELLARLYRLARAGG